MNQEKPNSVIPESNQGREADLTNVTKIISTMPKESLKSLLYIVAGRQDSNIKLFRRAIVLTHNDIIELNMLIQEKLQQFDTYAAITAVDLMYKKNRAIQFGTWAEFIEHNWKTPLVTESITVKWDFMIKLPHYPIPQRHTLTVKLLGSMNPFLMLQAVFSKDPDELSEIEMESAPVICRVDFINHLLSDELINIVQKWVDSRKDAPTISTTSAWLKGHKEPIARVVRYSLPVLIAFLSAAFFYRSTRVFDPTAPATVELLVFSMYWILASGVSIHVFSVFGQSLGSKIFAAIGNYGAHSMFELTNGDKNQKQKFESKNRKELQRFLINAIVSIVLDIIAAGLSIYLFSAP